MHTYLLWQAFERSLNLEGFFQVKPNILPCAKFHWGRQFRHPRDKGSECNILDTALTLRERNAAGNSPRMAPHKKSFFLIPNKTWKGNACMLGHHSALEGGMVSTPKLPKHLPHGFGGISIPTRVICKWWVEESLILKFTKLRICSSIGILAAYTWTPLMTLDEQVPGLHTNSTWLHHTNLSCRLLKNYPHYCWWRNPAPVDT